MWQEVFNWVWVALLIVITAVRKTHEYKAGQRTSLEGIPFDEAVLMAFWGVAAGVLPFFYIFGSRLDGADVSFKTHPVSGFTGSVAFVLAIWLLHRAHIDLGKSWSLTSKPNVARPLVTDGIYRRIRHPMYTAHLLWGVAQLLLFPNLIVGPLALLAMLALLGMRVPREERAMLRQFGDDYGQYMGVTGCFLPKLRTRLP
jgi:protein-S-isoprenylcysteine O-methyltransferase Ste14